jgi:hypothetical protein
MPKKGIDYSKWDNIEDSDEEVRTFASDRHVFVCKCRSFPRILDHLLGTISTSRANVASKRCSNHAEFFVVPWFPEEEIFIERGLLTLICFQQEAPAPIRTRPPDVPSSVDASANDDLSMEAKKELLQNHPDMAAKAGLIPQTKENTEYKRRKQFFHKGILCFDHRQHT